MKFSELKVGECYSFIRKDKSKDAPRCYVNIISNNKKRNLLKYNVVLENLHLEVRTSYKKDEPIIGCRPITLNFFKKKLINSKDYMTGIPYLITKTKTVIKSL